MKTLVISDIHANLHALDAVLSAAGDVDRVWCMGDLMGYGPDPNGVITRLRQQPGLTCLAGNHDFAALSLLSLENFNSDARKTIEWQRSNLSEDSIAFLQTLKPYHPFSTEIQMVHGSPMDPMWGYVLSAEMAQEVFDAHLAKLILVGHTHIQGYFKQGQGNNRVDFNLGFDGKTIQLDGRFILNPGSIGQPRDRDPRASFAIFDDVENTWSMRRADYDHRSVSNQILKFGLPSRNAVRLSTGS